MNDYEARQEARRERLEARADRANAEANALFERAHTMGDAIPFGQPILVGHHSETRDRNYRARIDRTYRRSFEAADKAKHYEAAAASVGTAGISQDDPDAIDKLRAELAKMETHHSAMVDANKIARSKKTTDDDKIAQLVAMGFTEANAHKLITPQDDYERRSGRVGFPSYSISNHGANMRRIKERIELIERLRATEALEATETEHYTVEDDADRNRLVLRLTDRVERDVFTWIRSQGWRWSRTEGAFLAYRTFTGRLPWFLQTLTARAGWTA